MSKWIEFLQPATSESGKTSIWPVTAVDGTVPLGEVRWFGRWRKYAFFPLGETVFEEDCLRDIADFCERQTKARKA